MNTLTERLAHVKGELLRRKATCDAATPGPYTHEMRQSIGCMVDTIRAREADGADWEVGEMRSYPGDAEFVVLARTALPSAIDYLLEDCRKAQVLLEVADDNLKYAERLAPRHERASIETEEKARGQLCDAEYLIARLEGVTGKGEE